jgi:hypothetical protein
MALKDEDQQRGEKFLLYMGRHLVSLSGTLVKLDRQGNDVSDAHFFACSGFVVSLGEDWYLLTAGHVLHEFDEALRSKEYRLASCGLADYFGPDAKVPYPTPFVFEDAKLAFVDNADLGLDIGLIPLREYYRTSLSKNGVAPVTPINWRAQDQVQIEHYALLGFPDELTGRESDVKAAGAQVQGGVRPVLMFLNPVDAVPDENPNPVVPWFAGELRDKSQIKSVKGMSGGPIFGYKTLPDGRQFYWVVAVQSRWREQSRIVFGCPLRIFMPMIEAAVYGRPSG